MNKQWYKSKTVWTAVVTGVLGIVSALGYNVPEQLYAVLGALGLYGLRDAIKK